MVAAQQLAQVRAAARVAGIALGRAHRAHRLEGLGDLPVQLHPVGHHHEGPVAGQPAQHLLGEEHHRKALAAALRLPEHAAAAVALLARGHHRRDGVVHAQHLVVLPDHLHQPGLVLGKQREVLHQVQQAGGVAGAAQHHLQRDAARLVLARHPLPLEKPAPVGRQRAHPAGGAVAGDQQRVEPEKLGNLFLVMRQVLVEGGARRHAGLFQFDHHPGQAVDKAHQVGPAGVERAGHAELADQQKVVARRVLPIHHAQALGLLAALRGVGHRYRDAFFQQRVDLAVGRLQAHGRAVAAELVDGGLDRLGRQAGVEGGERRAQARHQHHLALGLAPQAGAAGAEGLVQRHGRLPAQRGKELHSRLLDELVFGPGVGAHGGQAFRSARGWKAAPPTAAGLTPRPWAGSVCRRIATRRQ